MPAQQLKIFAQSANRFSVDNLSERRRQRTKKVELAEIVLSTVRAKLGEETNKKKVGPARLANQRCKKTRGKMARSEEKRSSDLLSYYFESTNILKLNVKLEFLFLEPFVLLCL